VVNLLRSLLELFVASSASRSRQIQELLFFKNNSLAIEIPDRSMAPASVELKDGGGVPGCPAAPNAGRSDYYNHRRIVAVKL
jgi:hypothetical protein